jgi:hypothetical protein
MDDDKPAERDVGARIRVKAERADDVAAAFKREGLIPIYVEPRPDGDVSFWFGKLGNADLFRACEAIPRDWNALKGNALRAHPLSFLRPEFDQQKIVRCADLARIKEGRRIEVAGIVLVRQRPGSTNVTFVTIEDETGIANLIIWQRRFEAQRRIIMSAAMLHVRGVVQREGEVIHVIAERLEDYTPMLTWIGDMPFPHRHAPADGANGGGPDPRERKLVQIKDDYSAPFRIENSEPGFTVKSRNFH